MSKLSIDFAVHNVFEVNDVSSSNFRNFSSWTTVEYFFFFKVSIIADGILMF